MKPDKSIEPAPRPAQAVAPRRGNASRTYFLSCLAFAITLLVAGILHDQLDAGVTAYCTILFAICVGPALLGRHNARHRILSVFMGCYFVIFGLAATVGVVTGEGARRLWGERDGAGTGGAEYALASDAAVIIGALMFLAGYFLLQNLRGNKPSRFLASEWRYGNVLFLAFFTWLVGFIFMATYDMTVSPLYIPTHVLGLPVGIASNLRLFSPLGAVMLIYLVTRRYRPTLVWTLLGIVMASEFVLGFLINSKESSFRIPVLLFIGLYFLNGKVSKKILLTMLLLAVPYFLFFNAYRLNMMEQQYRTPGEAFADLGKNLEAVKDRTEDETNVASSSLQSLTQRVDGKVYIDIIVAGTDSGSVERLWGESLTWFFESFVPRFLWPGKTQPSIGQLFNHEFNLSASRFTFVPTTQLGELYWNFGMAGVIVGMMLIGVVFGQLSSALLDRSGMTLPRFMTLLMATYYLAVRFEGNIASQYSTFVRLLILIWLVDRLMRSFGISRRLRPPAGNAPPRAAAGSGAQAPPAAAMKSVPG
jgi:hypothetical protein